MHIGLWWRALIGVVTPLALTYVLVDSFITDVQTPYGDPTAPFPTWMLAVFGWGSALAVIVVGFVLARLRWRDAGTVDGPVEDRTGPTSSQEGVQR